MRSKHCPTHNTAALGASQVITIYQELAPDPSFSQPSSKPTVAVVATNGDEHDEAPPPLAAHRKLLGMKAVVGLASACDCTELR